MKEKILGVPTELIALLGFGIVIGLIYSYSPILLDAALYVLSLVWPLWLIPLLLFTFWRLWVRYRRANFIEGQKYILLEVRLPREIRKSPLAMEAVFAGLHQGPGEATFIHRYFLGQVRPWYSLELVSIDGNIHFYIWTRAWMGDLIKSQIYSNYPEVEIYESEDYTSKVPFDLEKWSYWGCNFKLTKEDAIPIKTYVDYRLDNPAAKEEEKTDPMTNLLEIMGSLPTGHQMWVQIIIQLYRGPRVFPWQKAFRVGDQAEQIVEKILKKASERGARITKSEGEAGLRVTPLTQAEQEQVAAIQRSVSKLTFDAGIRGIYMAEKDKFQPIFILGMIGAWKAFSSLTLNGFAPFGGNTGYDYPWQDYKQILQNRARRRLYQAYRLRSWFHEPFKIPAFVLNTEELATIFHFPGEVAKTPTVPRIASRRAEAPSNLPT